MKRRRRKTNKKKYNTRRKTRKPRKTRKTRKARKTRNRRKTRKRKLIGGMELGGLPYFEGNIGFITGIEPSLGMGCNIPGTRGDQYYNVTVIDYDEQRKSWTVQWTDDEVIAAYDNHMISMMGADVSVSLRQQIKTIKDSTTLAPENQKVKILPLPRDSMNLREQGFYITRDDDDDDDIFTESEIEQILTELESYHMNGEKEIEKCMTLQGLRRLHLSELKTFFYKNGYECTNLDTTDNWRNTVAGVLKVKKIALDTTAAGGGAAGGGAAGGAAGGEDIYHIAYYPDFQIKDAFKYRAAEGFDGSQEEGETVRKYFNEIHCDKLTIINNKHRAASFLDCITHEDTKRMLVGEINDHAILFNFWMNLTDDVINNQLILMDKRKTLHSPLQIFYTRGANYLCYDESLSGPGNFYGEEKMMNGDIIIFLSGYCYHSSVDTQKDSPNRNSIEARMCLKGLDQKSVQLLNELFGLL